MGILDFAWDYIVIFLIVLTIVVFVHEWGHFYIARRNGVRVEIFSVGFGPEIWGWNDKTGTRWRISALPLGGYVKMLGEGDQLDEDGEPRQLDEEERKVAFNYKKVGQRAAIIAAGPVVNIVFAAIVLIGLAMTAGAPDVQPYVASVLNNSAASAAGIKAGDTIVSVAGTKTPTFTKLSEVVSALPGRQVAVVVHRGDADKTLEARIGSMKTAGGETRGLLGVRPDMSRTMYHRLGPVDATVYGVETTFHVSMAVVQFVGNAIFGHVNRQAVGGPLRIAEVIGKAAQVDVNRLIFIAAMLSANLGMINLVPIPGLDGGHLALLAVEAVRGRPLNERVVEYGLRIGFAFILCLIVVITWNDLVNLGVFEFLKGLGT